MALFVSSERFERFGEMFARRFQRFMGDQPQSADRAFFHRLADIIGHLESGLVADLDQAVELSSQVPRP